MTLRSTPLCFVITLLVVSHFGVTNAIFGAMMRGGGGAGISNTLGMEDMFGGMGGGMGGLLQARFCSQTPPMYRLNLMNGCSKTSPCMNVLGMRLRCVSGMCCCPNVMCVRMLD